MGCLCVPGTVDRYGVGLEEGWRDAKLAIWRPCQPINGRSAIWLVAVYMNFKALESRKKKEAVWLCTYNQLFKNGSMQVLHVIAIRRYSE